MLASREFANHNGLHQLFEIAIVIQELGVLQHLFVRLHFDANKRFKQFALGLRALGVKRAALLQTLVDAGVFGITPVLGPQLVILAVQLFDFVMDGIERADVGRHFFLADFAEFLLLEQPLQLFAQGDEFGVLLHSNYETSMEIARALLATMSYPFVVGKESIDLGVSIGVASNNSDGDLLRRADVAMYRAKRESLGVAHFDFF